MSSADKIKCPKCNKYVAKRVVMITHGKCNNCGYGIAGSISSFLPKTRSIFDTDTKVSF